MLKLYYPKFKASFSCEENQCTGGGGVCVGGRGEEVGGGRDGGGEGRQSTLTNCKQPFEALLPAVVGWELAARVAGSISGVPSSTAMGSLEE